MFVRTRLSSGMVIRTRGRRVGRTKGDLSARKGAGRTLRAYERAGRRAGTRARRQEKKTGRRAGEVLRACKRAKRRVARRRFG